MPAIRGMKINPFRRSPLLFAAAIVGSGLVLAADPLPPKPSHYVSDAAGVLSPQTVTALNSRLEAFERETSNQLIVAIFPKIPDGYAFEDFTQRTAEAWGVGQSKDDNGVVLFVFPNDRRTRIEVGYGLEGALPDALAKRIIEDELVPAFRAGDFDTGIRRGVNAILQATRGEYRGSGRTNADVAEDANGSWLIFFLFVLVLLIIIAANRNAVRRGTLYGPRGRRTVWTPPIGGGWSSGGGGSWSGGGGGFSGGGGSFGGGGASGSW
jgi:uncharacterized protein